MAALSQVPAGSQRRRASSNLARADAIGRPVGEVMIRRPKTLRVECTVAELREQFENPHVRAALLVDGERFAGLVYPDDVPTTTSASAAAVTYARRDVPTIRADADVADALAVMDSRGERRLVVLDADGVTLSGLLCLDKTSASFCRERSSPAPPPRPNCP
jgi:predicted transcriptional regulator